VSKHSPCLYTTIPCHLPINICSKHSSTGPDPSHSQCLQLQTVVFDQHRVSIRSQHFYTGLPRKRLELCQWNASGGNVYLYDTHSPHGNTETSTQRSFSHPKINRILSVKNTVDFSSLWARVGFQGLRASASQCSWTQGIAKDIQSCG
jgi:hypothetical protein